MMFRLGNIVYIIELLLGATIFLYPAEKRSGWLWRYLGVAVLLALFGWYHPLIVRVVGSDVFFLFRSVVQLCAVILAMMAVFRTKLAVCISSCVAGYAVQHIAYNVTTLVGFTSFLEGVVRTGLERHMVLEAIVFPVLYLVFFLSMGRFAARNGGYLKTDTRVILLSFITVFICAGLRNISSRTGDLDSLTACLYSIVSCMLSLLMQVVLLHSVELKHENETINRLWQEERKHYAISKSNIELLNIKCHDLKHTLTHLEHNSAHQEEIDAMREMLRIYDSSIRTGNEALDVLLMENNLSLAREGITIHYTGNGADLTFMNATDVYTLFGNAVDNAVEAVRKLDEPDKRLINIVLEAKGEMVVVNISNYFDGNIVFQGDFPETSKQEEVGYHGFGMKSMKLIVEKYNGGLKASVAQNIFQLSIYLMRSE